MLATRLVTSPVSASKASTARCAFEAINGEVRVVRLTSSHDDSCGGNEVVKVVVMCDAMKQRDVVVVVRCRREKLGVRAGLSRSGPKYQISSLSFGKEAGRQGRCKGGGLPHARRQTRSSALGNSGEKLQSPKNKSQLVNFQRIRKLILGPGWVCSPNASPIYAPQETVGPSFSLELDVSCLLYVLYTQT